MSLFRALQILFVTKSYKKESVKGTKIHLGMFDTIKPKALPATYGLLYPLLLLKTYA